MRAHQSAVAATAAQIADAQRLRYQVYVEEERLLVPSGAPCRHDRRWIEARDFEATTAHLLVYAEGQPVGTVRLSVVAGRREPGAAPPEMAGGEPAMLPFEVTGLPRDAVLGVVERFCVLRRFRATNVTPALYAGLRNESRR